MSLDYKGNEKLGEDPNYNRKEKVEILLYDLYLYLKILLIDLCFLVKGEKYFL